MSKLSQIYNCVYTIRECLEEREREVSGRKAAAAAGTYDGRTKGRSYRILPLVLDVEKTSTPRFHSIMVCHLQDACHKTIPHTHLLHAMKICTH